jgi:hypothetical protein
MTGLSLLLYPLWWILLGKYRQDFQEDWHQRTTADDPAWLQAAVTILDALAVWVIDLCPKVTTAILLFHIGMCLAYLSSTMFTNSRERDDQKHEKEE